MCEGCEQYELMVDYQISLSPGRIAHALNIEHKASSFVVILIKNQDKKCVNPEPVFQHQFVWLCQSPRLAKKTWRNI